MISRFVSKNIQRDGAIQGMGEAIHQQVDVLLAEYQGRLDLDHILIRPVPTHDDAIVSAGQGGRG